jgi:hypothetical protein
MRSSHSFYSKVTGHEKATETADRWNQREAIGVKRCEDIKESVEVIFSSELVCPCQQPTDSSGAHEGQRVGMLEDHSVRHCSSHKPTDRKEETHCLEVVRVKEVNRAGDLVIASLDSMKS